MFEKIKLKFYAKVMQFLFNLENKEKVKIDITVEDADKFSKKK